MACNVLIVDDSMVMRKMLIRMLHLSGVSLGAVYQASNGADGLKALADNPIDLALVDINMPVMNGEEMIKHVREDPPSAGLSIIVVSTEASETRIEQLRANNVRFIHKPFDPADFYKLIKEMTGAPDGEQSGDGAVPSGGHDF